MDSLRVIALATCSELLGGCLLPAKTGGGETADASTDVSADGSTTGQKLDGTETSSSTSSTGGEGGPHENGWYPCQSDAECISGNCFEYTGQGICGECDEDSDCASGLACAPPNAGVFPYEPPHCDDGGLGSACSDDTQCLGGRTCRHVLEIPGIYDWWTCADCAGDADCAPPTVCTQTIVLTETNGWYTCVEPSSLELAAPCDLLGNGDLTCQSGACAAASIDGLVDIGICSECDDDLDCGTGAHCVAPDIDTALVLAIAGYCEPDA